MLIFKKAKDGTLSIDGLKAIASSCDVATEGVKGAKSFFEAKVSEQAKGAKFEQEIKGKDVTCTVYLRQEPKNFSNAEVAQNILYTHVCLLFT